ncbi:DUF1552 domain-containing protein [Sorangium sp. So ce291]|uniref:DUF1552 domain-containing protein n=1 Tax=Sorangium sp. So ce291 TaxID=3133294 RepID=UPI003F60E35B
MAFACNITRVASVMWGGGESNEAIKFGDIDISAWHSVSHSDTAFRQNGSRQRPVPGATERCRSSCLAVIESRGTLNRVTLT